MDPKSLPQGGPAFPHPAGWRRDPEISDGMSLRDYFAAKAMAAFCHGAENMGAMPREEVARQFGIVGEFAYSMADAMLKARDA